MTTDPSERAAEAAGGIREEASGAFVDSKGDVAQQGEFSLRIAAQTRCPDALE